MQDREEEKDEIQRRSGHDFRRYRDPAASSPEQVSCPISPEKEAANQSENVTAPIKLTEGDDQAVPCAEINGKQEGK